MPKPKTTKPKKVKGEDVVPDVSVASTESAPVGADTGATVPLFETRVVGSRTYRVIRSGAPDYTARVELIE